MDEVGEEAAEDEDLGEGGEEEEEDIEDPQEILREKCRETKKCSALLEKLETCNARVQSRKRTEETCEEELFEFVHCVDNCVCHVVTPSDCSDLSPRGNARVSFPGCQDIVFKAEVMTALFSSYLFSASEAKISCL